MQNPHLHSYLRPAERVPVIAKSYALMGYQAVNVGHWDLRQQKTLTQEAQQAGVPLLFSEVGDERLIEQVTGINLLIGNADWATLKTPLKVRDTLILPTSVKGQHLGRLDLTVDKAGKVEVVKHQLIPLTPDIANDGVI